MHGSHTLWDLTCAYSRVASYYNATINGKTEVNDVAWCVLSCTKLQTSDGRTYSLARYYPETKKEAEHIKGYVAFYKVNHGRIRNG